MGNSSAKSIEPGRQDSIKLTQHAIHTKNFKLLTDILDILSYPALLNEKEIFDDFTLYHYIVLELLTYSEEEIAAISSIILANSKKLGSLATKLPVLGHFSLIVYESKDSYKYEIGHKQSIVYLTSSIYDVYKYKDMDHQICSTRDPLTVEVYVKAKDYYQSFFNINGSTAQEILTDLMIKFRDTPLEKKLNLIQDILTKIK